MPEGQSESRGMIDAAAAHVGRIELDRRGGLARRDRRWSRRHEAIEHAIENATGRAGGNVRRQSRPIEAERHKPPRPALGNVLPGRLELPEGIAFRHVTIGKRRAAGKRARGTLHRRHRADFVAAVRLGDQVAEDRPDVAGKLDAVAALLVAAARALGRDEEH